MDVGVVDRLARLRGRLSTQEPGARGLERVARNPACQRLKAITMVGSTPSVAVAEVYREDPKEGQSPFALSAGNRFERHLVENGAERLLELYRRAGRLSEGEGRVVVVPELLKGKNATVMASRRQLTERFIRMKAEGDPKAPNLIIKGRLAVILMGVEHGIEPDALVAADGDRGYRPVEMKSYPDRAGKTDPSDVRGACRQASVAVVGLRQLVERLGLGDPEELVPDLGDLVLRQPGSYLPTLREMTLRAEVFSLERAFDEAPRNLAELERLLRGIGAGASLDDRRVLDAIPNNYLGSCREHCALASVCKRQAAQAGDPVLLGNSAREDLAAAGSIRRSLQLLYGRGEGPRSVQEKELQTRLREAGREYVKAVGDER